MRPPRSTWYTESCTKLCTSTPSTCQRAGKETRFQSLVRCPRAQRERGVHGMTRLRLLLGFAIVVGGMAQQNAFCVRISQASKLIVHILIAFLIRTYMIFVHFHLRQRELGLLAAEHQMRRRVRRLWALCKPVPCRVLSRLTDAAKQSHICNCICNCAVRQAGHAANHQAAICCAESNVGERGLQQIFVATKHTALQARQPSALRPFTSSRNTTLQLASTRASRTRRLVERSRACMQLEQWRVIRSLSPARTQRVHKFDLRRSSAAHLERPDACLVPPVASHQQGIFK